MGIVSAGIGLGFLLFFWLLFLYGIWRLYFHKVIVRWAWGRRFNEFMTPKWKKDAEKFLEKHKKGKRKTKEERKEVEKHIKKLARGKPKEEFFKMDEVLSTIGQGEFK